MKIFNWTERRNSFSDWNTGTARRAVLSVPAHLKPARKRRAHNCSHQHSTAQHSTGIPYPPTAHTRGIMKWRELGHFKKEDQAENSKYCRYEGKETSSRRILK